jgi:DNA-binding transcriptional LysR family regulator
VLVASPDYLVRHGVPRSLAELDGHRGIFYTNRGVADWRFPSPNGAAMVRGQAVLRLNNGDMMRDAAIAGLGIALLPTFIVGAAIKAGDLNTIEVGIEAQTEFVYVAHPEGRRPSTKLPCAYRMLSQHVRSPAVLGLVPDMSGRGGRSATSG